MNCRSSRNGDSKKKDIEIFNLLLLYSFVVGFDWTKLAAEVMIWKLQVSLVGRDEGWSVVM